LKIHSLNQQKTISAKFDLFTFKNTISPNTGEIFLKNQSLHTCEIINLESAHLKIRIIQSPYSAKKFTTGKNQKINVSQRTFPAEGGKKSFSCG